MVSNRIEFADNGFWISFFWMTDGRSYPGFSSTIPRRWRTSQEHPPDEEWVLLVDLFLFGSATLFCIQTVIAWGESILESINTTFAVDVFHFSRVKRMTNIANVDFQRVGCCSCRKLISATASNFNCVVFGMDPVFHFSSTWTGLKSCWFCWLAFERCFVVPKPENPNRGQ